MSGFFGPTDYGPGVQGQQNLSATATTNATAAVLQTKISIFTTVGVGGIVLLPHVTDCELIVLNRGANALTVATTQDLIETYGTSVFIAPGGNARFMQFTPPSQPPPWTWWLS